MSLTRAQVDLFIREGFVAIRNAFHRDIAAEAREILWRDSGMNPMDPTTWIRPYVRLNAYSDAPFLRAADTPILTNAFDQLVGPGRWRPLDSMATFPLRFPSLQPSGDTDWHVDMSFGPRTSDTLQWRANVRSTGRALLMLFHFSDVGENDAPTRLRVGSHFDVARLLATAGPDGLSLKQLIERNFGQVQVRDERLATGPAGTVYLCHPFLVHAGQDNPRKPKFIGQPALIPTEDMRFDRAPAEMSPIEQAVVQALRDNAARN